MAWIVVKNDSGGLVAGAYMSERRADFALASMDTPTDFTVVDTGDVRVPQNFSPNQRFWRAGAFATTPMRGTAGNLQAAGRLVYGQFRARYRAIEAIAEFYPPESVTRAKAWIAWGHHGANRVMRSKTWTSALRIKFAEEMADGPSGALTTAAFITAAGAITAPTQAVAWVTPVTGAKWTLAQAVANTASMVAPNWAAAPTQADIVSGAWAAALTG